MDRPKIDGIVDYIKAAYPDSWRDYVLCRAGTEEPIAVMFPHMGRIYYAPTLSMFEKAGPHINGKEYTGKKSWIANRLREIVASAPINR